MKRLLKFAFAAVLVASAVVASFAFTSKEEVKFAPDAYFLYIGPDNSIAEVTDPFNYQPVGTQPTSQSPFNNLSGIYVTTSLDVYPSGSGSKTGLPKVDVAGTFQTDLLDATDATKREFRVTNYHIYLKP